MKIVIVTDLHHGPASHTKDPGWNVLPTLARVVAEAEGRGANLILDLGDHISDTSHDEDRRLAREVAEVFALSPLPKIHLLGNHDVANLSVDENAAIFGQPLTSRSVDLGGIRLIVWQPGVSFSEHDGFPPVTAGLEWLVDELNSDYRPAIVVSHVPLSGHSQSGNYYFENRSQLATYPDQPAILNAVEKTGKVALWLSGHVHWTTVTPLRGITHITVQSMNERFTTAPATAEAYADLDIDAGDFSLTVHGNDPFHVRQPLRASGERPWMAPMAALEGDK